MTPTTLYSDKKLFLSFYKNTLSRLKGIALLYGILMFITFPMFYCINISEAMERLALGKRYYGFEGHLEMYPAAALFFFAVIVGAVISLSAIAYSFMHSKKSVDVFHALPIRRPVMLLAGFGAVVTWMFALELICYLVVGAVSIFTIPIPILPLIAEIIRVFVLTAAIAAIAAFCAVCCNTVLDSAIFTLAFNAVVPCYTLITLALLGEFVAGFSTRMADGVINASIRFSPVCMLYQSFFYDVVSYTVFTNLIYLAFTAVLMAVACAVYVKRKSERAQSNNVSGVVYRFIILAASVGGGAFFGYVFSELFGWGSSNRKTVTIILMSCLFTAVIYLIFNAVTSRRVNPGKKGLVWMAASLVLTCGMFASVTTGFFGMESYVPNPDEIASIKLYYSGDYDEIFRYIQQEDGTYIYSHNADKGVDFTNPEDVAVVRGMHSRIVDSLKPVDKDTPGDYYYNYYRFEVEYTLENGRTVRRDYYREVPESVVRDFMLIDDMESFKRQLAPVLLSPASDLNFFEIKDGFGKNLQKLELDESEKEMLYNAIAQDTLNLTSQMKKQHSELSLAKINMVYKTIRTDENGIALSENSSPIVVTVESAAGMPAPYYEEKETYEYQLYSNAYYEVTSASVNTIRALKELGLAQYTQLSQPENLKAVVSLGSAPYYDTRSANFWTTGNRFTDLGFAENIDWSQYKNTYYDAQQVSQIAESCTSIVYSPAIEENEPVFAVVFTDADTDLRHIYETQAECSCYYMTYDEAPQFIRDQFAQYIQQGGWVVK